MRQLISRIDEGLHARLKVRAREEGRSMNALVEDLLRTGLASTDERAALDRRLERSGLGVPSVPAQDATGRNELIGQTVGLGRAASEALESERSHR